MAKSNHNRPRELNFVFRLIRFFIKSISILIPPLGFAIAYKMFFRCRSFARPAHEWDQFKSANKYKLKLVGEEIQVYEWGEGEKSVLFHHGWQGRGSSAAMFVEPLVKAGYKVIAYDGPAHGESTGEKSNLPQFADLLKEMSDRYNGFEAIIAHSFGGMVTSYAIQKYSINVKRLVFISSPFTMSFIVNSFSQIINTTSRIARKIPKKIEKEFNVNINHMSGEYLAPKQELPLLLIHDEDDYEVPVTQSEHQHKLWQNSKLIKTNKLGHRRILRDENVIIATMEFIRQEAEIIN